MDKREIKEELISAIEVYQELGFRYFPIKQERITDLLNSKPVYAVSETQAPIISEPDNHFSLDKERALQQLKEEIGD